jgi:hypothetical protein
MKKLAKNKLSAAEIRATVGLKLQAWINIFTTDKLAKKPMIATITKRKNCLRGADFDSLNTI